MLAGRFNHSRMLRHEQHVSHPSSMVSDQDISVLGQEYLLPKGQSAKIDEIDLETRIFLPEIFCVSLDVEYLASSFAIDNSDHRIPNSWSMWINAKISVYPAKKSNLSLIHISEPTRLGMI